MAYVLPGYKATSLCTMPKSNRIVKHKTHAYNEHGQVIVVDAPDEDREAYVNSFKDTVGLKNILAQLIKAGENPVDGRFAYNDQKDAMDVSGMPSNINDLTEAAKTSDKVVMDALKSFNDAYGTSYTLDEFLKKSADGTLINEIIASKNATKSTEEGESK